MVTQSRLRPVPLLLTRPAAQGIGFEKALRLRFGDDLRVIKTPLMAPRFFAPMLPPGPFAALILTSQTGVEAFSRLNGAAPDLPRDVYCVGEQTAALAKAAGLNPLLAAPDAAALISQIAAHDPNGRLLHLRGQDARGDVAENLISAEIDTVEWIVYAQEAQELTPEAIAVLQANQPVLIPLFSPRTAKIFAAELTRVRSVSPLFVVAISGQVVLDAAINVARIRVAATPDADAMLTAVGLLREDIERA